MCHGMLVRKEQRKKDMNSKSIVMSLGTDIECGGAQIHHNNMNCSSLRCRLLLRLTSSLALLNVAHPQVGQLLSSCSESMHQSFLA